MKKYTLLFLILLMSAWTVSAQQIDMTQLKKLEPRNIGPAGMSGRVTCIDVVRHQPEVIYIGTASGGVWKSTNGGVAWTPIFDEQTLGNIGAIAINQNNPAEIWVGTGEGNPRNSHNYGEGIYRSIDAGKTWTLMGLENTRLIHRIYIHPDNSEVIYVGALGSAWGPNKERGFYKTTDGGKTWRNTLYVNDETGIADMVVDPSNPNKIMAAMWEFGRKPWTFNSGGEGSGLYFSFDGGETWEERTEKDGLPKGNLGRMGLAIAPSKPNIMYALVEAEVNVMLKSTDGGYKWKQVADDNIGNRPFYYADIFVDPQNENRIFNLWSIVSKSEDGGKTFESLLPFTGYRGVHPDHHAFYIHPDNPKFIIEGNDGGLNISRDGGATWRFVENLPLAQFYHINYDMETPYNVYGGMQDNGSWVGPSAVWQRGGIKNYHWQELYFGDGFDVVPKPNDSRYAYAMSQGGNVGLVDIETGNVRFIKPIHPDGVKLRYHWNAGIAQDPFNDCGLYFGSQFLHYSTDCGQSWTIISPDLTTNDSTKQQQHLSGGLTIDDTNAENHTTIISIDPSPVDKNVVWVGTDDGNLQVTKDGGKTWTNVASRLSGMRANSWIPQVVADTKNAGEAYVVVNDYRRNDFRPMAYHTKDYGATFRRIVQDNQVKGHALAIAPDPVEDDLLFLGTDYGLWVSIDGGSNWTKYTNGMPATPVRDLKIHPREHDLVIGTFGRAAWILDDIRPFREMARTNGKLFRSKFDVISATDGYFASYKSINSARFIADAEFVGDNKSSQAMITVWNGMKPEKKDAMAAKPMDKGKKKKKGTKNKEEASQAQDGKSKGKMPKKAKVHVIDATGDTIRHFSTKLDTGMNRIYWNMRMDGVSWPSRREAKPDADPPSGMRVLPGTYKLVVEYGEHKDSIDVTAKPDPRLPFSMDDWKAKNADLEEVYKVMEAVNKSLKQVMDAQQTVKLVGKQFVNAPDSVQTEMKELSKSMADTLKQFEHLFLSIENQKGLRRNSNTIQSKIWPVMTYINAGDGAMNANAEIAMAQLTEAVEEALEQINGFFANEWKDYQEQVEAARTTLFEEVEPVKIE